MIRKIVKYPDPILAQVAKPIPAVDAEIKALLEDMVQTMYTFEGVGLAAPQVAQSIRAIVLDVEAGTERQGSHVFKMVNPEIISREGEIEWEEGCLSVPELRVSIKRSQQVTVRYLDENGAAQELTATDLLAVAIQHEIDHLNGKLIIDCASRLKRELYERRLKKMAEEEQHPL